MIWIIVAALILAVGAFFWYNSKKAPAAIPVTDVRPPQFTYDNYQQPDWLKDASAIVAGVSGLSELIHGIYEDWS